MQVNFQFDPSWSHITLGQTNEPISEIPRYYGYDPLPPGDDVRDPYEEYGYGCFETNEGNIICVDPIYNYGNYGGANCYYEYPYGYICTGGPDPYPYYYYEED